jgi:hypothetical protein
MSRFSEVWGPPPPFRPLLTDNVWLATAIPWEAVDDDDDYDKYDDNGDDDDDNPRGRLREEKEAPTSHTHSG